MIGVICCVTVLPSTRIVTFDKAIDKTQHKLLVERIWIEPSGIHYQALQSIWIVIFLVLISFRLFMVTINTKIYYNIAESLPSTLDSNVANAELEERL